MQALGTGLDNPYGPFISQRDWEVARWAKCQGPSSTAFTDLMKIDGVVEALGLSYKSSEELNRVIDMGLPGRPRFERHEIMVSDEVCDVYIRDVLACIQALFGDPAFSPYLIVAPERHFTSEERTTRVYHDMHTGRWWWSTQEAVELDKPGATIIPLIVSTDKTQLTLFRNKSAYPVYLTIGNIPKEIRWKPSSRAYVLLGYLPTTRLQHVTNVSARRRLLANLYHACMGRIFSSIQTAGADGTFMTSSRGIVYRAHPLLACIMSDYPEHVLTTCVYSGECPTCPVGRDMLGEYNAEDGPALRDLAAAIEALDSFHDDPANFLRVCKDARIRPVYQPYWLDLPYSHINRSITPDVLHQLYQGIMKHLINWVVQACGATEVDARCRRMPPNHNIRLFMKGISSLSRVSGEEHDYMCRILLGLVIDTQLPDGLSNARLLACVRALLDFLYLAQYPIHTDATLAVMDDALQRFHDSKDIFCVLGIRESFNIPKLHWACHYSTVIQLYGTTDNVNTQYTERLHIDFAKDAYAATNHKDEFSQMAIWLERREKLLRHAYHVKWRLDWSLAPPSSPTDIWQPPGLNLDCVLHLSKHPTVYGVSFEDLTARYGASLFRTALARFVALANDPRLTAAQLERRIWTVQIPFRKVAVWHQLKFLRTDPFTKITSTMDSVHARPESRDGRGRLVPGRFDVALINEDGNGDVTGIEGYRAARIRVIFSLPHNIRHILFEDPTYQVPQHLAYVEWYTRFDEPMPHHYLHKVSVERDAEGYCICSIVPVDRIRRSIHLFPRFGVHAPPEWTSSNVLDLCDTFFVNVFTDRHLYRILY
ncbi:hypothetical protein BGW80DRAFT_1169067 [Lactifluus volemus]|nr:hypothetical protein BGW80DRAFT_1169067 [Lactifluus volemus]